MLTDRGRYQCNKTNPVTEKLEQKRLYLNNNPKTTPFMRSTLLFKKRLRHPIFSKMEGNLYLSPKVPNLENVDTRALKGPLASI